MLKQGLLTFALGSLLYAAPAVLAQDNSTNDAQAPAATAPPEGGPSREGFDPQKRSEMLAKRLNLSSDQQSKVQGILQSEQSDIQKVRADSSVAPADRRSKMMDIHKASGDQIRALLNPDQQKKWDEIQARQEARMEHRHRGQSPAAVPPAPEQK